MTAAGACRCFDPLASQWHYRKANCIAAQGLQMHGCIGRRGVVRQLPGLLPEDLSQLHANEAAVKEMEAAGISWVRHGSITV